jgi:hypothetical protein
MTDEVCKKRAAVIDASLRARSSPKQGKAILPIDG